MIIISATRLAASADDMPKDRTRVAMASKRCMLNYLLTFECSSMGLKVGRVFRLLDTHDRSDKGFMNCQHMNA